MSICFIVNPKAGKGKGKKIASLIHFFMKKYDTPYEVRFTTQKKEGEPLAKRAVEDGFEKIVAVGGDGTIYEVLNGIIGKSVSLGIIPSGTGNDFARCLGIGLNVEEALDIVVYGQEKSVDCGRANERYFINVAGIGFDTETLKEVERLKKYLSGKWAYIAGVLKTLLTYKFKKTEIIIDGQVIHSEVLLIAIANGSSYGGGMKIAPDAINDDGLFDVCVIHRISKLKILKVFPTIFSGKHIHIKEVNMYKAKKISINSQLPTPVNLDGDIVGYTPLLLEIIPNAIKVLIKNKNQKIPQ